MAIKEIFEFPPVDGDTTHKMVHVFSNNSDDETNSAILRFDRTEDGMWVSKITDEFMDSMDTRLEVVRTYKGK
jgi:hypothetical protein